LSATQLDANASTAGTFAYSPDLGSVLSGGAHSLSVRFTPTDTANYVTTTQSVQIEVTPAASTLTWTPPAAITYGTALAAAQLKADASVGGTFVYTPPAGTILTAGLQTLSVVFTPNNTANYSPASTSVSITVNPATPVITWANPDAITAGTPLSATQLNATAGVPGTFVYTPGLGTVLSTGNGQILSVTFTPTDSTDYTSATKTVKISVH
jgi:hypothetical protein